MRGGRVRLDRRPISSYSCSCKCQALQTQRWLTRLILSELHHRDSQAGLFKLNMAISPNLLDHYSFSLSLQLAGRIHSAQLHITSGPTVCATSSDVLGQVV